jgi:hypothetical protein
VRACVRASEGRCALTSGPGGGWGAKQRHRDHAIMVSLTTLPRYHGVMDLVCIVCSRTWVVLTWLLSLLARTTASPSQARVTCMDGVTDKTDSCAAAPGLTPQLDSPADHASTYESCPGTAHAQPTHSLTSSFARSPHPSPPPLRTRTPCCLWKPRPQTH